MKAERISQTTPPPPDLVRLEMTMDEARMLRTALLDDLTFPAWERIGRTVEAALSSVNVR